MAFASRAVHALLLPYFVTRLLGHLMRTDEPDGKEWSAFLGSGSGMKNFAMDSGGANKFSMCRIFVVNDKENEASWLWNSGLAGALAPHITDARIYGPTTVPFYLFASLEWPSLKEVTIDFGSTEFKGPEPSSFPCRFPALENLTIYADVADELLRCACESFARGCPALTKINLYNYGGDRESQSRRVLPTIVITPESLSKSRPRASTADFSFLELPRNYLPGVHRNDSCPMGRPDIPPLTTDTACLCLFRIPRSSIRHFQIEMRHFDVTFRTEG